MTDRIFKVKPCSQKSHPNSWNRGYFWCPGCNQLHAVNIDITRPPEQDTWTYNGNENAPTLLESVRVHWGEPVDPTDLQTELFERVCHSQVTDGKIMFYGDCNSHNLQGQTLPLPPLPSWFLRDN